jgi:hypothetical protein
VKRRKQGRLRPLTRADRQARQAHNLRTGRSSFLWPHRRGFEQHRPRPKLTATQARRGIGARVQDAYARVAKLVMKREG